MAASARSLTRTPGYRSGSYVLFGATAVILTALAFEHIGGYAPCPLCIMQRYAYYAAIPLAFLGLIAMSAGWRTLGGILFLLIGLAFLVNTALAGYHAGVEWKFWPGPDTCDQAAQPLATGGAALLDALKQTSVISCAEPALRVLGLSFAGWNVITSLILSILALVTANLNLDQSLEINTNPIT